MAISVKFYRDEGTFHMEEIVGRPGLFLKYWVPLLAYAAMIFTISSFSFPQDSMGTLYKFVNDKMLHALEYGVLGILFFRAFRHGSSPTLSQYSLPLAIGCATMYGVTDEIHQYFVPLREMNGWDVMADFFGASIGVIVWQDMTGQPKALK